MEHLLAMSTVSFFFSVKPAKLHFWVRQQIDTGNQEPVTKETQYGVLKCWPHCEGTSSLFMRRTKLLFWST